MVEGDTLKLSRAVLLFPARKQAELNQCFMVGRTAGEKREEAF